MGGGASKGDETSNKQSKDSQGNARSAKGLDSPRASNGAGAANDNAGGFSGLNCTVMDAVTNSKVTFQSSVSAGGAGGGRKKGKKAKEAAAAAAAEAAQAAAASGEADSLVIAAYEGTVTVDPVNHHKRNTSAASIAAAQVADRGDLNAALSVLHCDPSASKIGSGGRNIVPVGGAFVQGAPTIDGSVAAQALANVGVATPQQAAISGSSTPAGGTTDMIPSKYTPQAKAAVFTSKAKFAIPVNYTLTHAGGQPAAVRTIAASADGAMFASVVAGGKVAQYFDGITGQLIMEIRAHLDPVVAIAHSRDGKFLLTSSNDGNVCLWDLNNGKKLREIPVTSQANAVAISDDSETIATSSTEDFVNLWESRNAEALTMFQRHSGAVYCVAFSRRGNLVASGSQNGEVFVWGAQAGDVRLHVETGARSAVMHVAFSHDGTRLITADRDVLQVWDLFTGGLIFSRNGSGDVAMGEEGKSMHQPSFVSAPKELPRITCATFAACNNVVCGLTSKKVLVLDPNTGTELLCVDVKALVTCVSANWAGDVIFIGDYCGNHYRLVLQYAHRDVLEFGLNSKPPSKDKGKADRD